MEHVLAALTPANRLVCEVCVSTGLRVGDVVSLRTSDLKPQFWITEQKTRKRKRVNLTKELYSRLSDQAGPVWVFTGRKPDKHRTRQAVWHDVKRAAKAFRLPQNVGVHSFRKVYAVGQIRSGRSNLARLQRVMNHADMSTTLIYAMAYQLYLDKYGNRAKTE